MLNRQTRHLRDGTLSLQARAGSPRVSYTRGLDLSGTLAGAGGSGGLRARSRHATSSPYAINGNSFYHADGNGNVTYLASASGGTDAAYRYDPFGRWLAQTGPYAGANAMHFSSKPWVAHNGSNTDGLYYYGYRFYDPLTQRWLNKDPLGEPGFELLRGRRPSLLAGGPHKYLFVQHNPVSIIDPLGLWQWGWPPWGNKKKDEKCCEKKDASPYKELANKFLTDLTAKVQEAEAEIGREKVADILDKFGKFKFAIDSIKSICDAANPDGCDNFLYSGELDDCLLCCTSIHGLFSSKLAGLAFLTTCRNACAYAE